MFGMSFDDLRSVEQVAITANCPPPRRLILSRLLKGLPGFNEAQRARTEWKWKWISAEGSAEFLPGPGPRRGDAMSGYTERHRQAREARRIGRRKGEIMKALVNRVRTFVVSEDGPTATEYAVMLALIIIIALAGISLLGTTVRDIFNNVAGSLPSGAGA
jgi:pilus assembly protein Flp/PilA